MIKFSNEYRYKDESTWDYLCRIVAECSVNFSEGWKGE